MPLLARAYLRRGLVLWVLARAVALGLLLLGGGPEAAARAVVDAPLALAPVTLSLTMALGVVDVHVRHERALLANLGVSPVRAAALFAGAAAAGELALYLRALLA